MTDAPRHKQPSHDDISDAKGPPSDNPLAGAANITVSLPEAVEVKLVDATALADYEVWSLLTSILGSAFIGFLVATLQEPNTSPTNAVLRSMTLVIALLLAICAITAFSRRRRLAGKVRRLRFRLGELVDESD
ncbi:MAG: hypothetical protein R3B35_02810 [Gemmatimonadales bacterium]